MGKALHQDNEMPLKVKKTFMLQHFYQLPDVLEIEKYKLYWGI